MKRSGSLGARLALSAMEISLMLSLVSAADPFRQEVRNRKVGSFPREYIRVDIYITKSLAEGDVLFKIRSVNDSYSRFPEDHATVIKNWTPRSAGDEQWTVAEHVRDQIQSLQWDVDETLRLGGDWFFNVPGVTWLLESLESDPGCTLGLVLLASSLPFLFLAVFRAHSKRFLSIPKRAAKRLKVKQSKKYSSVQRAAGPGYQLTALHFVIQNKKWQCVGYDICSKTWRTLPPFSYLPDPNPELFQQFSLCGHAGLMCANVSATGADLVVFNPLTGRATTLPPLLYPRRPVLLSMLADPATHSYKVIVAGSSDSTKDPALSKKVEVFDSKTSKWEETEELPGPAFGLNEYQTGVCVNGILYFLAFLDGDGSRGVLAFDVIRNKWLPSMTYPIPHSDSMNMAHLVENDGELYLFYEKWNEKEGCYKHCIDVLEVLDGEANCHWRTVAQVKCDSAGLLVYPQYMCVGFGNDRLCIFDTLKLEGVVVDSRSGKVSEGLGPRPVEPVPEFLHTLNPSSFTLQLSCD